MTNREFLDMWGFASKDKDSLRRAAIKVLKKSKGPLTPGEQLYLSALLVHLSNAAK